MGFPSELMLHAKALTTAEALIFVLAPIVRFEEMVAELFAKHDASELCVRTWCQLDFPLAEQWGGRLEREGTIAMGRERCDFRWQRRGK